MEKTSVVAVSLVITGVAVFILPATRQSVFVKTPHTGRTVKIEIGVPSQDSQLLLSASSTLENVLVTLRHRSAWQATDLHLWSFTFVSKAVEASIGCLNQRQRVVSQDQRPCIHHRPPLALNHTLRKTPRKTKFPLVKSPPMSHKPS